MWMDRFDYAIMTIPPVLFGALLYVSALFPAEKIEEGFVVQKASDGYRWCYKISDSSKLSFCGPFKPTRDQALADAQAFHKKESDKQQNAPR